MIKVTDDLNSVSHVDGEIKGECIQPPLIVDAPTRPADDEQEPGARTLSLLASEDGSGNPLDLLGPILCVVDHHERPIRLL
ncbi:hypothetical protein SDC9_112161 [bioreactor metagenome]|uniref:Uncharacterized protein n=1 Tax=bioreactor metagenome TaxID=1076179 RepID=A0A645BJ90_9ZZZZ